MSGCNHEVLKADPYRFVIELDQIGEIEYGDETLILANCKCGSTLAIAVEVTT